MPTSHLSDRGVVRVAGEDAKSFLDGLVTCDIDRVTPAAPRFGALLTPQGKILFDFIVFQAPEEAGGGYCLDVLKAHAGELAKRLGFYRLRAKVQIDDRSDGLSVVAGWGDAALPPEDAGLMAPDPRLPALGWRAIVAASDVHEWAGAPQETYHAHRIALGPPVLVHHGAALEEEVEGLGHRTLCHSGRRASGGPEPRSCLTTDRATWVPGSGLRPAPE